VDTDSIVSRNPCSDTSNKRKDGLRDKGHRRDTSLPQVLDGEYQQNHDNNGSQRGDLSMIQNLKHCPNGTLRSLNRSHAFIPSFLSYVLLDMSASHDASCPLSEPMSLMMSLTSVQVASRRVYWTGNIPQFSSCVLWARSKCDSGKGSINDEGKTKRCLSSLVRGNVFCCGAGVRNETPLQTCQC
jgi:hypothetical protein